MYNVSVEELKQEFIEKFHCEKLLEIDNIDELTATFRCKRNPTMEEHIIKDALDEDKSNESRHYIVKDNNDNFVFYFSLRCGLLSKPLDDSQTKLYNKMPEIITALDSGEYGKVQEIAQEIGISSDKIVCRINSYTKKAALYTREMSIETEKSVYRVSQSMPSVELVQFCANSNYEEEWKKLNFPIPLGASVFWFLIIPIVKKIQDMIGCEYVHLFAADMSDELTLCSYYSNDLGFQYIENLATFKPFYDFTCIAMYLNTKNIDNLMREKIGYLLNDVDAALEKDIGDI